MEIYTATKQAYYDLLYSGQALTVGKENQQIMGQLAQLAPDQLFHRHGFSAGRAAGPDRVLQNDDRPPEHGGHGSDRQSPAEYPDGPSG